MDLLPAEHPAPLTAPGRAAEPAEPGSLRGFQLEGEFSRLERAGSCHAGFTLMFPAAAYESCAVSYTPGRSASLSLPTTSHPARAAGIPRRLQARCSTGTNPASQPGMQRSGRATGQAILHPSLPRDFTLSSSSAAFFPPFFYFPFSCRSQPAEGPPLLVQGREMATRASPGTDPSFPPSQELSHPQTKTLPGKNSSRDIAAAAPRGFPSVSPSRTSLSQIAASSFQPSLGMPMVLGLQGEEEAPMAECFPIPRSDGLGKPGTGRDSPPGWVRAWFFPQELRPTSLLLPPSPGEGTPGSSGAVPRVFVGFRLTGTPNTP